MLIIAISFGVCGFAATTEMAKKTPYPAHTYNGDRNETGPFFRKLRRIRAAEGNAAAAARIDRAWEQFTERRKSWAKNLTPRQSFDTWAFWVWHEAQFDTGLNDPEWSLMLYQWIYAEAQKRNWPDWVTHVRPNLIQTHGILCQWARRRMVLNVAEDYFAGISFNLDPGKLPAVQVWDPSVPFVMTRQFPVIVPSSKHVVSWQRQEQKDSSKPTFMDNLLIGLMEELAWEDYQMGRWDRAIERNLWILAWSEAVNNHNANPKRPYLLKREEADSYRNAKYFIATTLNTLGYREKALEMINHAFAETKTSMYSNYLVTMLKILQQKLLWQEGTGDEAVIAAMDAALTIDSKEPGVSTDSLDSARLLKAACLASMGKTDEAEALIVSICHRKKRSQDGWMDAELALVDLFLKKSEWNRAEKNLRELIRDVRVTGVKINELALYQMYVKWAMQCGKWEEALKGQREVLRLLEAFRMTPLQPLEQARLARILAETGNLRESEELIATAKSALSGRDQHFIKQVHQELDSIHKHTPLHAKADVLMQPRHLVTVPIAGFPTRTVITLMNHGNIEAKGRLKVSGLSSNIAWDESASQGVIEVHDTAEPREQTSEEITIASGKMVQFSCFAELHHPLEKHIHFEWKGDVTRRCEWQIGTPDSTSEGAVIDAGSYNDDPFFMIPVHHHLQSKVKGAVNLRVVTSQPCRVELYDEKGVLQMVDAEGNGSLENNADWLGTDFDRNLSAEIQTDASSGEARFMLLLDPAQAIDPQPLKVRIDWFAEGTWQPAAEDQITSGK